MCPWDLWSEALWRGQRWPWPTTNGTKGFPCSEESCSSFWIYSDGSEFLNPSITGWGFPRQPWIPKGWADSYEGTRYQNLNEITFLSHWNSHYPSNSCYSWIAHICTAHPSDVWGTYDESRDNYSPFPSFPFLEQTSFDCTVAVLG